MGSLNKLTTGRCEQQLEWRQTKGLHNGFARALHTFVHFVAAQYAKQLEMTEFYVFCGFLFLLPVYHDSKRFSMSAKLFAAFHEI